MADKEYESKGSSKSKGPSPIPPSRPPADLIEHLIGAAGHPAGVACPHCGGTGMHPAIAAGLGGGLGEHPARFGRMHGD